MSLLHKEITCWKIILRNSATNFKYLKTFLLWKDSHPDQNTIWISVLLNFNIFKTFCILHGTLFIPFLLNNIDHVNLYWWLSTLILKNVIPTNLIRLYFFKLLSHRGFVFMYRWWILYTFLFENGSKLEYT